MTLKSNIRRLFVVASIACLYFSFASFTPHAGAVANGANFQAGRIIDDVVFTNNLSMSVAQIQAFLDAKVPVCDRWHASSNPSYQPPWTCLKEYQENLTTGDNNLGPAGRGPNGEPRQIPGGISAAQIIWNAAQAYNINPQVILATLQKEQSLVTDDWPWALQYWRAMGNRCPDGPGGANCDSNYAGFYKQVDGGTWQFRHDFDGIGTPNYWAPYYRGWNNILYNVQSTGCGTKSVFIENQATAVLYKYTPYTPNQAALNNLYGTGDGCSSYGNRNFWRLFTDWFGSTFAPDYDWIPTTQYAYTDATKTTPVNLQALSPGQRVYVGFTAKNNGNRTWVNNGPNPVRVGASNPGGRISTFCDTTWISCARPSNMIEASVEPGETATFEFWMTAPAFSGGSFTEYFNPLSEGSQWMVNRGLNFNLKVTEPVYTWQPTLQAAYTDETKTQPVGLGPITAGTRVYLVLGIRNTGNMTWSNTGPGVIRLAPSVPGDRVSMGCDPTWLSCQRVGVLKEASVAPGAVGTFEFWYRIPSVSGVYREYFSPVVEGVRWMPELGLNFYMNIEAARLTWIPTAQYAYTNDTMATPVNLASLTPGQRVYIGLKAKNTGNITWKNTGPNPTRLGTSVPGERASRFCDPTWIGCNRPTTLKEASVAPGAIGTFEFWYQAPTTPGVYREYFLPLVEGQLWFQEIGLNFYSVVN